MNKDAYYFSHDSNAFHDPKIIKLRSKHGLEGYGFYWAIIEYLRNQSDYCILEEDLDLLSFYLNFEESKIKHLLSTCLAIGLLKKENGKVFSDSLLRRMDKANKIRGERVRAGRKGGMAKAKSKQNPSKSLALKESKGKESKVNKTKEEDKKTSKKNTSIFKPPTIEEVASYCLERNNGVDSVKFHDFYSSKGWMVGKNKMKDWEACVRTWEKTTPKPDENGGWIK